MRSHNPKVAGSNPAPPRQKPGQYPGFFVFGVGQLVLSLDCELDSEPVTVAGVPVQEARGVGIFHLGKTNLAAWPTPIPPIAEQARIVEILEGHLSRPGNHG